MGGNLQEPNCAAPFSAVSDHCPLLVTPKSFPKSKPFLRFERFWTQMNGYLDCVSQAWLKPVPETHNSLATLHKKLSMTTKALKLWSKNLMSQSKAAMAICREVIAQLDKAQEFRGLLARELNLCQTLKSRLLALAAIEKSRAR
jgi:hypothetical protein